MTDTKRIAYGLFAQSILLLMLYAAASLLGAVKFLGDDPLVSSLPFQQVSGFANTLLNLAILSGLLGGGIYSVASENPSYKLRDERLLKYTFWLWTALLAAAFFAGLLGLLEGRFMLELPPALDVVQLVGLALFLYSAARGVTTWTPTSLVWTAGMVLSGLCAVIGLIQTEDYVLDRVLRALAVNLNLNVAYVLASAALGFWLIPRFSNASRLWAEMGVYTVGGVLALAGVLVSVSPLYSLGASSALGNVAVFLVPLAYLIFAAHSYRALSDRNPTNTLAAHWYGLAALLFLLGVGFLGGLQAAPGIGQWTLGAHLNHAQVTLASFAVVAVILGVINQAAAEMRGQNARVTGLAPFWLLAFGALIGGPALGVAGVVQVYLERISSVGYLETQALLVPLYVLWVVGLLLAALGILAYALGFWLRRPEVQR